MSYSLCAVCIPTNIPANQTLWTARICSYHLLSEIKAISKYCTTEEREILEPIISWNGFYAHPENILLSLLASTSRQDRILGITTILEIRRKQNVDQKRKRRVTKNSGIRLFRVPYINFKSESISQLTDLTLAETEPPLTLGMSEGELKSITDIPMDLGGYPCHTTSCERAVQITSAASLITSDRDMQDGHSFNKIEARSRNVNAHGKKWNVK